MSILHLLTLGLDVKLYILVAALVCTLAFWKNRVHIP